MKIKSTFKESANNYLPHTRNANGITLIALVVTIIILIILAMVSIGAILGDNGLINMATKSSEEYTKKAEEEQKQLNDIEDYINDITNSNWENYDDDSGKEETPKLETPKLEKPTGDDKTLEIGEVVINNNPLDKGWKYFCQDEDNYYFIYEDFFDSDAIPNPGTTRGGWIRITEPYNLMSLYSNSSNQERQDDLVNYLLGAKNYAGIWDPVTEAIKEALRKKDLPEEEINKISTTGSPMKEQFADAYNERYGETKKLVVTGQTSNYYGDYNLGNFGYVKSLDLTDEEIYNNDLFFPHHEKYEGCPGYWLASASNMHWYVCYVSCMDCKLGTNDGGVMAGIRPLVKIPKSLFE